ncbi:hypothetical protein HY772_08690 [Candidatus Woesearchaeota archaeon]|nr:hypothetical protein [Candidatus Woesearchaeota archaeon]
MSDRELSDEEVRWQAVDFLRFYWQKTKNPEAKKKFNEALRGLGVTYDEFTKRIAAMDVKRIRSRRESRN